MRLLVYADLQATTGDERCFTDPLKSLQQYRVELFFKRLRDIYQEYGCDGLVDLGDTTDDRSAIPLPTIEALGNGLSLFPAGNHYKLTGNHEQFLRNASMSNRRLFSHTFHVVDGNENIQLDGWTAAFCAYPAKLEDTCAWLSGFTESTPRLLFGHFSVIGCEMRGGVSPTGVPRELLKPFYISLLGHIHKPQAITSRIHYVGSPFQQNWGESGEDKRVCVLDTSARTVDKMLTWIPMHGFPRYCTASYSELGVIDEHNEDRVRIVLKSKAEIESFHTHPLFHRVEPVYAEPENIAVAESVVAPNWTPEAACKRFVDLHPPAEAGIDVHPVELIELGVQIAAGDV